MQVRHECDWVFFTQGPSRIPAKALAKANHAPATPHLRLCGQNCFPQLVGRTPSAHERGRCGHEREDVAMKGKMWDVAMTMWQFS